MDTSRRTFFGSAVSAGLAALALAQEKPHLQRIDPKYVCFINKRRFDKPQNPVTVEGRTYYGCCSMCTSKLQHDPASRFDTDPVSGKRVDKATAVIGADSKGKVYFFETEEDLENFEPPAEQAKR